MCGSGYAIEKRPQLSGYFQVVRVLLPNQRQRLYPLTEIKEIIPGKGANLIKARQPKSDAKIPNEKLSMQVVLEPLTQLLQFLLKSLDFERGFWWRKTFGTTS